jgi:TolA-binding protein
MPKTKQRRVRWVKRKLLALATAVLVLAATSCGLSSEKKRYVLAEKLWTEGNYAASVSEFEKVYVRDPRGSLGRQALYRAATTEAYFLSQYSDAIKKFGTFAQLTDDPSAAWDAQKQIGEILFSKMELHDQAIQQYQAMLKMKPDSPDVPMYKFRIAKSQFFLWKFDDAVAGYRDIIKTYPQTPWAEKAAFEIGVSYYTRSERNAGSESYQDAIDAYESFLKAYPKSEFVPEAKFGIASCLEEMDQLDAAYQAYEALRSTYPSPKVIEIKLVRIRERKAQRSR